MISHSDIPAPMGPQLPNGTIVKVQYSPRIQVWAQVAGHDTNGAQIVTGWHRGCFANTLPIVQVVAIAKPGGAP